MSRTLEAAGCATTTEPASPIVYAFKLLEEALIDLHATGVQAHYRASNLFDKLSPVQSQGDRESFLAPAPFPVVEDRTDGSDTANSPFVQHIEQVIARIRAEMISLDNLSQRLDRAQSITEL